MAKIPDESNCSPQERHELVEVLANMRAEIKVSKSLQGFWEEKFQHFEARVDTFIEETRQWRRAIEHQQWRQIGFVLGAATAVSVLWAVGIWMFKNFS